MSKKPLTVDGRSAYGTGSLKTQPVYQRENGEYVKDSGGKSIVIGYRYRKYLYVFSGGKRVKTPTVSVQLRKHPKELSPAELKEVDRTLDRLIASRLADFQLIQSATASIEKAESSAAMIDEVVLHAKAVEKLSRSSLKDKAAILALDEFHSRFRLFLKSTSEVANQINHGEVRLAEIKVAIDDTRKGVTLAKSLAIACLLYISDLEGVRAANATRRLYKGYVRNHILVPTTKGGNPIGVLPVDGVGKKELQEFELSLYKKRVGYRLNSDPFQINVADYVAGKDLPKSEVSQEALTPTTVLKIIKFLGAVVEWCRQEPDEWDIKSPVNRVQVYKTQKAVYRKKKFNAPRTAAFKNLIKTAEEQNLSFMVPLMALVRISFRPAEARGLRWVDLIDLTTMDGKTRKAFCLAGTIRNQPGGEAWVAEGKTVAAIGQNVVVPQYILEILEKHRKDGEEYVCYRPERTGKNAKRMSKPFLTKHDYADGWQAILKHADLPTSTEIYTLKHGLIAELLLAGHTADSIQLMTRHTSRDMIMSVYSSMQAGDLADAIDDLHHELPQLPSAEVVEESSAGS